MNNENLLLDKNEEEFVFDFNTVLAKLFIYWKWLAVSVVGSVPFSVSAAISPKPVSFGYRCKVS